MKSHLFPFYPVVYKSVSGRSISSPVGIPLTSYFKGVATGCSGGFYKNKYYSTVRKQGISLSCLTSAFQNFKSTGNIINRMGMASSSNTSEAPCTKNRLQYEKSPYLLQHQANPVDWYPWSEEAFALARSKNKPIFLSVGYSTCHWCHVMERESFENPAIAKIMNEHFINIKMDREERPDIDRIYMTFVQAISGSGGWPMSVWMTPDLKPIYGGTYFPPDDRYFGRPGFRALLLTISEQWTENTEKCHASAAKIMDVLSRSATLPVSEVIGPDEPAAAADKCVQQLTRAYEPAFGGFSEHPKFPQPVNLIFLMDWVLKNKGDESKKFSVLKMAERTLKEMAKGGIHDHIGQGFARYSVDKKWHVPHFEKMLYDQAQLTVAYANAYLLTKDEVFADIVRDILTYVGRDLSHPEGGFYSAEDADSLATFTDKEKREGAFYAWKNEDIETALGGKSVSSGQGTFADVFKYRFGVKENGNVDSYSDPHDELKMQNVLFEANTVEATAKKFGVDQDEIKTVLEEGRVVLFNYRNINRPRPGLDSKFVTSWNGLMISGYVRAGIALKSEEYIERGVKAMDFLNKYVIQKDNGFDILRSCYRDETTQGVSNLQTPIFGCVDDFANVISASIELFHATFDPKYLQQAIKLQSKQDELFWDPELGGYFTSRDGDDSVIVRMKDDDDGAEPSTNSTSVVNLIRLHSLTQDETYHEKIEKLFKQFSDRLTKVPITLPVMTSALTSWSTSPITIILTGKDLKSQDLIHNFRQHLLPTGTAILPIDYNQPDAISILKEVAPKFGDKFSQQTDTPVIYVKKGTGEEKRVVNSEELTKVLA